MQKRIRYKSKLTVQDHLAIIVFLIFFSYTFLKATFEAPNVYISSLKSAVTCGVNQPLFTDKKLNFMSKIRFS